jgi:hypothetical protein
MTEGTTSVNAIRELLGLAPVQPVGDRVIRWAFAGRLPGWSTGDVRSPVDLPRQLSQREAMDDLLALWAYGLHPETATLAARWRWQVGEVAALKSVAEGLCNGMTP